MKLIRLYIQDFMCYSHAFIDFTQFESALIVGKIGNNDLYSNGVGKTTIFKAIEYVLFNQADVNLEKIIRDDSLLCKIVLDFSINDQEYRLSRTRNKKGITDISLLIRNSVIGPEEEVYHNNKRPIDKDELITKYWKDVGGRRAIDTEKELFKLIKINFNAFRSTLHFVQNDFSGLSTLTPNKRKTILKDSLDLLVYSKLEKLSKEKASIILKDIEKHKTLIDNLGDPSLNLEDLNVQLNDIESKILIQQNLLTSLSNEQEKENIHLNELVNSHSLLENKFSSLLEKQKTLNSEKIKIESLINEYQNKKVNIINSAKELVSEISSLKDSKSKLDLDFSLIDKYQSNISLLKDEVVKYNVNIQNNIIKYDELKIPIPNDSFCKHCRQKLTDEHKLICKKQIDEEIQLCQNNIKLYKQEINSLNKDISKYNQELNNLTKSKQQLEVINNKIYLKEKELQDKKTFHEEYKELISKFSNDLNNKANEILLISEEIKNSSFDECLKIKESINNQKEKLNNINKQICSFNKEISHLNATKAVIQNNILQNKKNIKRKEELKTNLLNLEESYSLYPHVIQAFSSTGIPNLIIQNILDDLQIEANNLLTQLKPGLQLSFIIEKTKNDGTQDETLDIKYIMNGKSRDYEQLSGAMKLAVTFSLKLGLSFLLQKMMGADVKLLLLDEIDQSLDKAGVDAFSDIVKFFQKDFTILIITHNDRLKDKFSHAILVNQDINMISNAEVVSSW